MVDLLHAGALALCLSAALLMAMLQRSLDGPTQRRLGPGLLWTAGGLLVAALRLALALRPGVVPEPLLLALGVGAPVLLVVGLHRLLGLPAPWRRGPLREAAA